jgi:hypothetical protein
MIRRTMMMKKFLSTHIKVTNLLISEFFGFPIDSNNIPPLEMFPGREE